jgi:putative hydrolase of the HAD superfamily
MSPSHPIQLVVFDIDDTLYPERQFVRSGYGAVGERLREKLGRDETFEAWLWQRFERGEVRGAFDALNDHFQLGLDRDEIQACVECYRLHRPDIEPYPGMESLLRRLAESCRLAVISDGPSQVQRQKLDATGLGELFERVLVSEDFEPPAGKPDPHMFEHAAERLQTEPRHCAYIGDNLAKDFVAPNALGWLSVYYRRDQQVHTGNAAPPGGEPAVTVHSNAELLAALGVEGEQAV